MYDVLPKFPHFLLHYKDMGMEYDVIGNHMELQNAYSMKEQHYTHLNSGIVLEHPLTILVEKADLHIVLRLSKEVPDIKSLYGCPNGTTVVRATLESGVRTELITGRSITLWVSRAMKLMMTIADLVGILVQQLLYPDHADLRVKTQERVMELFVTARTLGLSNWNFAHILDPTSLSAHSKNIVRAVGYDRDRGDYVAFMNGFVRKEFLADGYMIKELRRMYELERAMLKDKHYINDLELGDRRKIHDIIKTMSDKLCL